MCRCRDQADIALPISSRVVIGANHHQAGIFPLRSGIGLQRHGRESRDLLKSVFELRAKILIAQCLLSRGEGMHATKSFPRDGNHFHRRIELHRAGTERNHRLD